jgi:voltage-gated potassium channel
MWWSVATLTTVGYDDVAPVTALSKTLAAAVSLLGIALVAVPTGILAASFSQVIQKRGKESREPGDRAG